MTLSWQVRWDSFFCDRSNDRNSRVLNIPVSLFPTIVFLELFILFYNYYNDQNISFYTGMVSRVNTCNPSTEELMYNNLYY